MICLAATFGALSRSRDDQQECRLNHRYRTRALPILVVFLVWAAGCASPPVPASPERSSNRIEVYADTLARRGFSGAAYVRSGAEVLLDAGFGAVQAGGDSAISDSTLFYLASVSKQLTGFAVRLAEHRGLLRLDDRLGDHLPEVSGDKEDITIRQLLAHSSGLGEYISAWRDTLSEPQALESALSAELRFRPGSEYAYSNAGYTLLASILQRVSGRPFPEFLAEAVLRPAGMRDTYLLGTPTPALQGAAGIVDGDRIWSPEEWEGPGWGHYGAGGIVSTLRDLRRWARVLRSCDPFPAGVCASLREPLIETANGSYASGIRLTDASYGGPVFYHFGAEANGHGAAIMWFVEHDVTIVVLSNRSTPERSFAAATAVALARKLLDPEYRELPFYAEPDAD